MHLSTSNVICTVLSNACLDLILFESVPANCREDDHAGATQRMKLLAVSLGPMSFPLERLFDENRNRNISHR